MPELVFAPDFAFGLRGWGIKEANIAEFESTAQLDQAAPFCFAFRAAVDFLFVFPVRRSKRAHAPPVAWKRIFALLLQEKLCLMPP